ncbi:MAG: DNA (cytosine-5-)-methyltransferase [Parabacteroides sp.]|nr:DNA (cytosine-5-)-methyltransferase [Parabacteroides sp.]
MIYKTIDLCAGIGGIRRGFELTGAFQNVLSAEIDEFACKTYEHLFGENPKNDLTSEEFKQKVVNTEYDILLAGFPCQTFSIAGKKLGFRDATKGTIFFEIADIISRTNPRAVFLENVENLVSHDKGKTLETIIRTLEEELQYRVIGVSLDEDGSYLYSSKSFVRNSRFLACLKIVRERTLWHLAKESMAMLSRYLPIIYRWQEKK